MKDLDDYVRGHVAVYAVASYKSLSLSKIEGTNNYLFMKGKEVIKRENIPHDKFYNLHIDLLNHKNEEEAKAQIREQESYKSWVKFIKEQTGDDYSI